MKILWHCRTCDQRGDKNVDWRDIMKRHADPKEANKHVMTLIQEECKHDCPNPDVGVMVDSE